MKKKIRDLTEEEIKKVCDENNRKYGTCYNCPLQLEVDYCFKYLDLDKEIEVNNNEEN